MADEDLTPKEEMQKNDNTENLGLEKTKKELEETTDRLKRVMAEFENFKKRNAKERESLYGSLVSDIVTSFLPILDNLEKATTTKTSDEQYKAGIELVLKQMKEVLSKFGVEEIEAEGKKFDPELHEAVSSIQDENVEVQTVKEVFRKGYKIGNKVIRHAMVIVAN